MHRWVKLKLEMGGRMQLYLREYAGRDPELAPLAATLDRHLAQAAALTLQVATARRARTAATRARARLRSQIRDAALGPICVMTRIAARDTKTGVIPLRLPPFRADDMTFGVAVLAAAAEARRSAHALRSYGTSSEMVDDLLRLHAEWEAAGRRQQEAELRRIAAHAGLGALADQVLQLGSLLDAVQQRGLDADPARLAMWKAARHIPWPRKRGRTQAFEQRRG